MPPKHRKSNLLWHNCDLCKSVFSYKDFDHHNNWCPPDLVNYTYSFIRNEKLYSFYEELNANELDLKEKNTDLIYLSISALQICHFKIGSPLLVEYNDRIYIKNVFPIRDGSLLTIKFMDPNIVKSPATRVVVKNIPGEILPAGEVEFDIVNYPNIESVNIDNLLKTIKCKTMHKVLFKGELLQVLFYGINLDIEIKSCSKFNKSNIELYEQIENLYLEDNNNCYYMCVSETNLKFVNFNQNNPVFKLQEIGGYTEIIKELKQSIYTALHSTFEGNYCYGILLYGYQGTGKTLIAETMARESKIHTVKIQGPNFSKHYGDKEIRLRIAFQEALDNAPCIIILDNVETLSPLKGNDQERRIAATLFSLFDSIQSRKKKIVVIATSRTPDNINSGLRRPGRLEREIEIHVPNPSDRLSILLKYFPEFESHLPNYIDELKSITDECHGFVAADLTLIAIKARRNCKMSETVTINDIRIAFNQVKPSAIRQVYFQVPNVKWTDIGGNEELKLKLRQSVEWPLKYSDSFKRLGITAPKGVLLFGPPGCSKTMIAKALATESKLNFISVKGSDIFSKFVGESERSARDVFRRACAVAPSIIFLDELDALGGSRETDKSSSGTMVTERVLSQLLTEMDGVQPLENVLILAATNRPDRIDKALLRPGRLDRLIYVSLPTQETRKDILCVKLTQTPVAEDVNIDTIALKTEGFSGAEVVALCNEASLKAFEENLTGVKKVEMHHFLSALEIIIPITPKSLIELYENYIKDDL